MFELTARQPQDKLKFQIITFNVASNKKPENHFADLIRPNQDLYLVALEEVSMTAATILTSKCKQTELYV